MATVAATKTALAIVAGFPGFPATKQPAVAVRGVYLRFCDVVDSNANPCVCAAIADIGMNDAPAALNKLANPLPRWPTCSRLFASSPVDWNGWSGWDEWPVP